MEVLFIALYMQLYVNTHIYIIQVAVEPSPQKEALHISVTNQQWLPTHCPWQKQESTLCYSQLTNSSSKVWNVFLNR